MENLKFTEDEAGNVKCLVNAAGKDYLVFLENGDRVIYNPAHLHNSLPNRLVFRGIQNAGQGDKMAIAFLEKFGQLL